MSTSLSARALADRDPEEGVSRRGEHGVGPLAGVDRAGSAIAASQPRYQPAWLRHLGRGLSVLAVLVVAEVRTPLRAVDLIVGTRHAAPTGEVNMGWLGPDDRHAQVSAGIGAG